MVIQFLSGIILLLLLHCDSLSIKASTNLMRNISAKTASTACVLNKMILVRGGEKLLEEGAKFVVADRLSDAAGIMGGIRIPSALFAGAALGTLYTSELKGAHPKLRLFYIALTSLAFTLQICTVFISTIVSWRLVGGGFDPMAESGAKLLLKYFEISYLSAGSFFFGGILAFMLANTIRAYINFGNSAEAHMCSFINSLSTFYLLNTFDEAMVYFDDFGSFFGRFLKVFAKSFVGLRPNKMTIIYFLVTVGINGMVSYLSMKHARKLRKQQNDALNKT